MWNFLFDTSNWPPRWRCGIWSDPMGWTTIIAELAIWAAYMAIPLVLLFFIRKRKDIPFHGMFVLFAAFIIACGFTHLVEAIIFYFPVYRFLSLLLVITAVVSWATVIALIPTVPKILALPSLENVNQLLRHDLGAVNGRLESALTTLQAGVFDWDLKSNEMVISTSLANILKITPKEGSRPADDFFEKVFFEDKEELEHKIRDHMRSEEVHTHRFRLLATENQTIPAVLNWKVHFDEEHNPIRIVATLIPQR